MKKSTKITQDKKQTRATIPKEFVDKHKITKQDEVEWDDSKGKLKGELKKFGKSTKNETGERK